MNELNTKIDSKIQIIDATYDELFKKDIKQYDDNILYRLTREDYMKFVNAYINEDDLSLPRVNCISSYQYGYLIIFNTCGECYVESFDSIEKCKLYFEYPDIETDDLYNLNLNEIVQKYDYLFQKEIISKEKESQLYLTSLDDNEIDKYVKMDFHHSYRDLCNLIDNINDIYRHNPNDEINESLHDHIENLTEIANFLHDVTPIKKEVIIADLNKANETKYLIDYLDISKNKAEVIIDICYKAYLKSDDDISHSAIVTRLAEFLDKYDRTCSKYDFNEITPKDVLEAYYLLRDHDNMGALDVFDHASIIKNKGIAERIRDCKGQSFEKTQKEELVKNKKHTLEPKR